MDALEISDGIATKRVVYPEVKRMRAPWTRAIELIGKKRVDARRAYLFDHCSSVHTCFMSVPIDVISCDKHMHVINIETMPPWRMSSTKLKGVRMVVEATAGSTEELDIIPGCSLRVLSKYKDAALERPPR